MEKSIDNAKLEAYYSMIYKYVFVQIKNQTDAQDLTQEVFYKYFVSNIIFENVDKEKGWLFTVASNLCKNYWRSSWYKRIVPLQTVEPYIMNNIEGDIERKEIKEKTMGCIMSLPQHYREVIHLFYYEEFPIGEISKITGRKVSTIQTQLERARKRIKKRWEEESD